MLRDNTVLLRPRVSHRDVFYRGVIDRLNEASLPYVVGGGHALELYAAVGRASKDLDLFVRPGDVKTIFENLVGAGYRTELLFPHWLGKVYSGRHFIDIIFSSGNGICVVDDAWFEHAVSGEFFDARVAFCPPEEMIWSKSFVMERERYDGADVAHLVRACASRLDWRRLLCRFDKHWRILLTHLILFGFIYPSEKGLVPAWLMTELFARLREEKDHPDTSSRICRGTLLSRNQFRGDVESWGYHDARYLPEGSMTPEEAHRWTAAADMPQK